MKVSVIIPVYNAAQFLDSSIKSALDQQQTGEVLLIDDRSTDGSWEKCVEWVGKDSRVKLYKNEGIKGAGAARNIGLHNASCEYIAFLDADDYYLNGRFNHTESLFKKHDIIDGIAETTLVKSIRPKDLQVVSGNINKDILLGCKLSNIRISLSCFLKKTNLLITGITIKRKMIINVLYFDTSLKQTEDTEFMITLFKNYNIYSGIYDNPIVVYNFHENNTTKDFSESAYYRHVIFKKHVILCLKGEHPTSLLYYFFKRFLEYTYYLKFSKYGLPKKIIKILFIPIFIYYLFNKIHKPT